MSTIFAARSECIAIAFAGLSPISVPPHVIPMGAERRFRGHDGSHVDLVMLVPPFGAKCRKLVVKNIAAWHAPTDTHFECPDDRKADMKAVSLLLMMVTLSKQAVLDALGARRATNVGRIST